MKGEENMKKISILSVILPVLAVLPQVSHASTITLDQYTGGASQVILNLSGEGTTEVTFDVTLGPTTIADIRGVFFSWDGVLTNVHVTGADVTSSVLTGNGDVFKIANDVNMHGGGNNYSFDGGVEIGTPGIGSDDISATIFKLTANENIFLQDFGARLTSLGPMRNDSSKLYGYGSITPVPEPASVVLMGVGAAAAGVMRSRKRYSEN
jgi:hypothetical protein